MHLTVQPAVSARRAAWSGPAHGRLQIREWHIALQTSISEVITELIAQTNTARVVTLTPCAVQSLSAISLSMLEAFQEVVGRPLNLDLN